MRGGQSLTAFSIHSCICQLRSLYTPIAINPPRTSRTPCKDASPQPVLKDPIVGRSSPNLRRIHQTQDFLSHRAYARKAPRDLFSHFLVAADHRPTFVLFMKPSSVFRL